MPLSRRAKKLLIGIPAGLVIALLIVILLVIWQLNRIVKAGIEIAGSKATGVNITLNEADVSLSGKVELKGLDVGNPSGFSAPWLFKAGLIRVQASPMDLLKKDKHIREITLESPDFAFEFNGSKSNVGVVMKNLEKEDKAQKARKDKKEATSLTIDLLKVTDAKASVTLMGKQAVKLQIGELQFTDLNNKTYPEVLATILQGVTNKVQSGASGLTGNVGDMAKEFTGSTDRLDKTVNDITNEFQKVLK